MYDKATSSLSFFSMMMIVSLWFDKNSRALQIAVSLARWVARTYVCTNLVVCARMFRAKRSKHGHNQLESRHEQLMIPLDRGGQERVLVYSEHQLNATPTIVIPDAYP
jgi:hypothetical protein